MAKAVVADGLVKAFGNQVRALDGIDLAIAEGSVHSLLGPNGAGKTTAVRILSTLLKPDAGCALVLGWDVVTQPHLVRQRIGLSGQYAATDENLTGFENLVMVGRLYHMAKRAAMGRARALIDQFGLSDHADRLVKGYSGGMRRRLDLAASLIATPPVLFLDEPTTGLDPASRIALWDTIAELAAGGTAVLLTTQYLDEADRLADLITVIDHGRIIADGTPNQLKKQVGGERIEVLVRDRDRLHDAAQVLRRVATGEVHVSERSRQVTVPARGGTEFLVRVIRDLDAQGIEVDDAGLRRPTLDDVFFTLTGCAAGQRRAVHETPGADR